MRDILKDINSIWNRLFDHKVFLSGEIQFTLREYELQRDDVEVAYLFSLLEKVGDINSTQIDRLTESVNNTLPSTAENLNESLNICNWIIESEGAYQQDSGLELVRKQRKIEWEQFVDNIGNQCKEIDVTFEQKEEELQALYNDLQNKLSVTTSR